MLVNPAAQNQFEYTRPKGSAGVMKSDASPQNWTSVFTPGEPGTALKRSDLNAYYDAASQTVVYDAQSDSPTFVFTGGPSLSAPRPGVPVTLEMADTAPLLSPEAPVEARTLGEYLANQNKALGQSKVIHLTEHPSGYHEPPPAPGFEQYIAGLEAGRSIITGQVFPDLILRSKS